MSKPEELKPEELMPVRPTTVALIILAIIFTIAHVQLRVSYGNFKESVVDKFERVDRTADRRYEQIGNYAYSLKSCKCNEPAPKYKWRIRRTNKVGYGQDVWHSLDEPIVKDGVTYFTDANEKRVILPSGAEITIEQVKD